MEYHISGETHLFGNNIDTDQICPGVYLELVVPAEIAAHCLEGANPDFRQVFSKGDIIVAGTNFGCGSSREHAAISLKHVGAGAVIAKSFARIFYRNSINMGLPLIVCPQIDEIAVDGQRLNIDLEKNVITNEITNQSVSCEPISEYAMNILNAGGIKALLLREN